MLDESYPCRLSYTPSPIWLPFARALVFVGMIVIPWAAIVSAIWEAALLLLR